MHGVQTCSSLQKRAKKKFSFAGQTFWLNHLNSTNEETYHMKGLNNLLIFYRKNKAPISDWRSNEAHSHTSHSQQWKSRVKIWSLFHYWCHAKKIKRGEKEEKTEKKKKTTNSREGLHCYFSLVEAPGLFFLCLETNQWSTAHFEQSHICWNQMWAEEPAIIVPVLFVDRGGLW